MRQKLMALVTGLTLGLLIFTASALGDGSYTNHQVYVTTKNTIIGSMQQEGKPPIVVVVIRGKDAFILKKQCDCDFIPYPALNLVVLLDCSVEI